jgi:hypothetical protein
MDAKKLFPEVAEEQGISVRDDRFEETMEATYLSGETGGYILGSEAGRQPYEVHIFG